MLKTSAHLGLDLSSIVPADGEVIREGDVLDHIRAHVRVAGTPVGASAALETPRAEVGFRALWPADDPADAWLTEVPVTASSEPAGVPDPEVESALDELRAVMASTSRLLTPAEVADEMEDAAGFAGLYPPAHGSRRVAPEYRGLFRPGSGQ